MNILFTRKIRESQHVTFTSFICRVTLRGISTPRLLLIFPVFKSPVLPPIHTRPQLHHAFCLKYSSTHLPLFMRSLSRRCKPFITPPFPSTASLSSQLRQQLPTSLSPSLHNICAFSTHNLSIYRKFNPNFRPLNHGRHPIPHARNANLAQPHVPQSRGIP